MSGSRQADLRLVHSASQPGASAEGTLARIEWTVLRRLDGVLQGNYVTVFRGFGIDLADLREYHFGDDARTIDWNATARLDAPHVRQFNEEREITAWFVIDLSASVNFGAGGRSKRAVAVDFVALVARLLTRHGNRVGALLYSDRVERVLLARGGRRHVIHLVDEIQKAGKEPGARTTTRLAEALERALQVIKRRSVVIVVSDFISEPGWRRALALLGRHHELLAVRLYDALEREFPDVGIVIVEDAETGEQMFVDSHDAAFRRRFAALAGEREHALRAAFANAGADCIELATDSDLVDTLLRFARLRTRRAQLSSGGVAPALIR